MKRINNIEILKKRTDDSYNIYLDALHDMEPDSNILWALADDVIDNQDRLIVELRKTLKSAYLIKTDVEDLEKLALYLGSLIDKYNLDLNYRVIHSLVNKLHKRVDN